MDKDYKPLFLQGVKRCMDERLPEFTAFKVTKGAEGWDTLTGSLLFRRGLVDQRAAWVVWLPGPGVERYFNVSLGWSVGAERLPYIRGRDDRRYSATAPIPGLPGGLLDLEQIEGSSAIGGITIPNPWDQVNALKPMTSVAVRKEVEEKAASEAASLTTSDRATAVQAVLRVVMTRLEARLPAFVDAIRMLP
jgi:hypothetical protein